MFFKSPAPTIGRAIEHPDASTCVLDHVYVLDFDAHGSGESPSGVLLPDLPELHALYPEK